MLSGRPRMIPTAWFSAISSLMRSACRDVLCALSRTGLVLEIASGTGQHVVHFAKALPELTWQPSDADAAFRQSISSWVDRENPGNVRAPLDLL